MRWLVGQSGVAGGKRRLGRSTLRSHCQLECRRSLLKKNSSKNFTPCHPVFHWLSEVTSNKNNFLVYFVVDNGF